MALNIRATASAACMIVACILSMAAAGQNKNARIIVDQNADTKQLDTLCAASGVNSKVNIAITIEDASALSGFMVHVEFDSTLLAFERAEAVSPGSGGKPFLETKGGIPGPFFAKAAGANGIDIVSGIKSNAATAVSGNGLLAYCTFTRKSDKACSVKVVKAQLSDSQLSIDTIIGR